MTKRVRRSERTLFCVLFVLAMPRVALAQRELHWDRLNVDAHLGADGRLHVVETQTMVFTGDWNGGERVFNVRPQQNLSSVRVSRLEGGGTRYLSENSGLTSTTSPSPIRARCDSEAGFRRIRRLRTLRSSTCSNTTSLESC